MVKPNQAKNFFSNPAIFFSTLSPGLIAGGSQCALSYLQGVSELHSGRVRYVGPPFLKDCPRIRLEEQTFVGPRPLWEKVVGLAALRHVDRTSPIAGPILQGTKNPHTIIYVNGELAGRVVMDAKRRGFRSVFLPHNYSPDYLKAEPAGVNVLRHLYVSVAVKNAFLGCRHADLCLFLTQQDAEAYREATGYPGHKQMSLPNMYFGYKDENALGAPEHRAPDEFKILLNTNMALAQNEEGVLFFLHNIWPKIAGRSGHRLVLAGRYPRPSIRRSAAASLGVELITRPDHAAMEAIFASASVCVAATMKGSGIKLRVAEALRRGIPVVSTPHCAQGYESISPEALRIFRTSEEAVGHLDSIQATCPMALRAKCFGEYEQKLGFEAGLRKMSRMADFFDGNG